MVAKVTKAYKQMEDDVTRTAGLERKLSLCIGARVMLKRNNDVEAGLVNGSVGDIVGFEMKGDSKEIMFIKVQFPKSKIQLTYSVRPILLRFSSRYTLPRSSSL
jgi:hypothetical protein